MAGTEGQDSHGFPQPWLAEALERLDLRNRDRVLVFPAPTLAHVAAVRRLAGSQGRVLVIDPNSEQAERIAASCPDDVEVACGTPDGSQRLGTFDAVLVCPLWMVRMSEREIALLIAHNLRPGGRFVVDLPAEAPPEVLADAWAAAGGEQDQLRLLCGPDEETLATTLRDAGLRGVEAGLSVHLIGLENPRRLVDLLPDELHLEAALSESVERALVERMRVNDETEVLIHRCQLGGLR